MMDQFAIDNVNKIVGSVTTTIELPESGAQIKCRKLYPMDFVGIKKAGIPLEPFKEMEIDAETPEQVKVLADNSEAIMQLVKHIITLSAISPRISSAPDSAKDPETIQVDLLGNDIFPLFTEILKFSGLLDDKELMRKFRNEKSGETDSV